jgi:hypothetical protein
VHTVHATHYYTTTRARCQLVSLGNLCYIWFARNGARFTYSVGDGYDPHNE